MKTARLKEMVPHRDILLENQYNTGIPETSTNTLLQDDKHANVKIKCVCVWVLTPQLLLPLHLSVQEGRLFKEVCDLWPLLVLLGGVEHSDLRLLRQKLTDGMNRKHDLLHAAVIADDLHTNSFILINENVSLLRVWVFSCVSGNKVSSSGICVTSICEVSRS